MERHALLTRAIGGTAVRRAMRISKAIHSSAKTFDLGHTPHYGGAISRAGLGSFLQFRWARTSALSFEDANRLKQAFAFLREGRMLMWSRGDGISKGDQTLG